MSRFTTVILLISISQVFSVPVKTEKYDHVKAVLDDYKDTVNSILVYLDNQIKEADYGLSKFSDNFTDEAINVMSREYEKAHTDFKKLNEKAENKGGKALECVNQTEQDLDDLPDEFELQTKFCIVLERSNGVDDFVKEIKSKNIKSFNAKIEEFADQLEDCGEDNEDCLNNLRDQLTSAIYGLADGDDPIYGDIIELKKKCEKVEQNIERGCNFIDSQTNYVHDILKGVDECIDETA